MKSTKRASASRLLFAIILLAFALPTPSAAVTEPVSINNQPIAVQRRYFEDGIPRKHKDKTPRTNWQFRCRPQISYDVVAHKTSVDGKTQSISVKITAIRLDLSVPIVMWISRNEEKSTVEHEFGHVKICSDVYADAQPKMRDYAKTFVGKTYSGSGPTPDDACADALKQPFAEMSAHFTTITNNKAKRISEFYDHLDATTKLPIKRQIELAEKSEAPRSPTR